MSKIAPLQSPIVCTCLELTRNDFIRIIAENKNCDFEQLLEQSGAGSKCTACRLDLESIYVEVFDSVAAAEPGSGASINNVTTEGSLLRRAIRGLFYALDKVARPHPVMLRDFSPVVARPGIMESVQIANDSFIGSKDYVCDEMFASIILRNAEGIVVYRDTITVSQNDVLKVNLSDKLLADAERSNKPLNGDLVWGNLEVRRRWKRPTLRGTTRPQLLIEGAGGVGGVHTQGPSGRRTYWYTVLARPKFEKTFITVVNAANR
ncbi:MAG: (2Fe-2S)-binding protein, partial [Alphaproteobacteria bacterium]|nr:(2Fe-2S)-binding protein [Alphaproteobacteria bacterium]